MPNSPFRRALISVSNKAGLIPLAQKLVDTGCEIIASGGTAKALGDYGIRVTTVESITGFPEILEGRVKTLHPMIHGAILVNSENESHNEEINKLGIEKIDLVIVDLYPFEESIVNGAPDAELIEQIDIGGVALIRAAAKNFSDVTVITSTAQYEELESRLSEGFTINERKMLAGLAFAKTRNYDATISNWLNPSTPNIAFEKITSLRYGENPHQAAELFHFKNQGGIASAEILNGKEMSFNNYLDADAAFRAVQDHAGPTVCIIKHTIPCGISTSASLLTAYQKAYRCDPISAYGGVVAMNRCVTSGVASEIVKVFTEVVIAPDFDDDALLILRSNPNLRILKLSIDTPQAREIRNISGGFLLQDADKIDQPGDDSANWHLACGPAATPDQMRDLKFAWRCIRSVRSNAILIARDSASVGIGAGQVNRVNSARIAVAAAGDRALGAVAASDAFFPFPDGLQVLINAGVTAVVQPGGSKRDGEVTAAAQSAGITMYFTGVRHFSHS